MANDTVETRSNTVHIKRRGTVSVPTAWIIAYMATFSGTVSCNDSLQVQPKAG